jgi:hypothetical protein
MIEKVSSGETDNLKIPTCFARDNCEDMRIHAILSTIYKNQTGQDPNGPGKKMVEKGILRHLFLRCLFWCSAAKHSTFRRFR